MGKACEYDLMVNTAQKSLQYIKSHDPSRKGRQRALEELDESLTSKLHKASDKKTAYDNLLEQEEKLRQELKTVSVQVCRVLYIECGCSQHSTK